MRSSLYIALLVSLVFACGNRREKHTALYTCPMHPEIVRDQPGQCPICGMNLVEKITEGVDVQDTGLQFLLNPTDQFVLSQVKTISATEKEMPAEFYTTGIITYDTRSVNTVSARVSGRIDKLYVNYRFQPVSKGDKLMDIYSKELVTEQENFLFLLNNDPENLPMIAAAENKLELMGLTKGQIAEVRNSGRAYQSLTVYSPYSGHLHDVSGTSMSGMSASNAPSQSLAVQEGMYVNKGQTVFSIYNTDKVWAVLDVQAGRQGLLQKGQKVKLHTDGITDTMQGEVDLIEPLVRQDQKTLSVRVPLNNPKGEIRVGAIVKAVIIPGRVKGLFVPASAVLSLGLNSVVFIKNKDLFEARLVKTGLSTKEWTEVISGIGPSDELAENAQLLIDSESFVKTSRR